MENTVNTFETNQPGTIWVWKRIISNMTIEEIQRRSLLVSMCEPSEENNTFQQLLTEEYNKRNQ